MSEENNLRHNVVKLKLHKTESGEPSEVSGTDKILKEALGKLSSVVVVGYTTGEEVEYFSSSVEDSAEAVWLLERFKHVLISEPDDP